MANKTLLVRVQTKPGKEADVEQFLTDELPQAEREPGTNPWSAIRFSDPEFGIFDAFPDDDARQTHLNGPIGQALSQRADELFSQPPSVEPIDVLANKLPG